MSLNAVALFFQTARWFSEWLNKGSYGQFLRRGEAKLALKMHRMPQSLTLYSQFVLECAFQKVLWLISPTKPIICIPLFIIHHFSLKPNSKYNQWDIFKTCLGLCCPSLEAPDLFFGSCLLDVVKAVPGRWWCNQCSSQPFAGPRRVRQLKVACSREQCDSLH